MCVFHNFIEGIVIDSDHIFIWQENTTGACTKS